MNNLDAILEVAIGLIFAWLILSVAVMQAQEWIGAKLAWRAEFLEKAIANMLRDQTLVENFYKHPLIESLSEPLDEKKKAKTGEEYRKPSYIPAQKFACAAFDVIMAAGNPDYKRNNSITISQVRATVDALKAGNEKQKKLAETLESFFPNLDARAAHAEISIANARASVETWFDDTMDRLSGWYKRHASKWALILGMTLALIINIDTVEIAQQLWREPTMRETIVAQAAQAVTDQTSAEEMAAQIDVSSPEKLENYYQNLTIPVGWSTAVADSDMTCGWIPGQDLYPGVWVDSQCRVLTNLPKMNDGWGWLIKLIGIAISGVAAAQGAPFWFDLLKQLINLRGSGNIPQKSENKPQTQEEEGIPPAAVG